MLEEATSSENVLVPTGTCLGEQKKETLEIYIRAMECPLDLSIFNENLRI